ncbi:hypothetical protein AB6D11_00715 [Vibrio splendidus]
MTRRILWFALFCGAWMQISHSASLNDARWPWWESPLTVHFSGWTGRGVMALTAMSDPKTKHATELQAVQWDSFYDHPEPRHAGHQPYQWGVRYVIPAYLSADLMSRTGKNREKWLNRLTGIAIAVGLQYSLTHPTVTIRLEPWFQADVQGIAIYASF